MTGYLHGDLIDPDSADEVVRETGYRGTVGMEAFAAGDSAVALDAFRAVFT